MLSDGELRTVYRNRNISYGSVRSEKNYPIKKRRIFNYSSVSNFNGGISGEDICVSPKRVINGDVSGLCSKIHEGIFTRVVSFFFFFWFFCVFGLGPIAVLV